MVTMKNDLLIDTKAQIEIDRIVNFLKTTLHISQKTTVVVASSGGIDSSVSLALSIQAFGAANVYVLSLPYTSLSAKAVDRTKKLVSFFSIPETNFQILDITGPVDACRRELGITEDDKVRIGNIMARMRMIYVYDQAKKLNALVVGTENKTEYHLGYFTRFGDEASDIEPIQHLYKTQIYMLARELSLPDEIISQTPTAGLWTGQTDETQLGFSYEEADQILSLHFEKHIPFEDLSQQEFPHVKKIQQTVEQNKFKHSVPYIKK